MITGSFDLKTPQGQQQAINEIFRELNDQYEDSQSQLDLQVAAYGSKTITPIINGSVKVVDHGLGYAPMFLAYFGQLSGGSGIFSSPVIDFAAFNSLLGGAVNFYVDSQSLYCHWDDHLQTSTQFITYLIFDTPLAS